MTQVICISRGTHSGGRELAEQLARKLDYACLGREELNEAATNEGIPVGRLEMAMLRPGIFSERLALERDHYLAFTTSYLCDKAMEGGLVYHGRTGHFLLPGVSHVLKVRVLADPEYRIKAVMRDLGLERGKARRYIEDVDEDRRRWVHSVYAVSWEDAANYDVVLNLAQVSMENAATVLMHMAQLPDFQTTPASRQVDGGPATGSQGQNAARTGRTHPRGQRQGAGRQRRRQRDLPAAGRQAGQGHTRGLQRSSGSGRHPRHHGDDQPAVDPGGVPAALGALQRGGRAGHEVERRGGAHQARSGGGESANAGRATRANGKSRLRTSRPGNTTAGSRKTFPKPRLPMGASSIRSTSSPGSAGRGGDGWFTETRNQLVDTLDRSVPYTLVVLGDLFLSKGHAAKLRATRDLRSFLSDRIKAPVVTADELGGQYFFGRRDILRTAVFLLLAVALYYLVFTYQEADIGIPGAFGLVRRGHRGHLPVEIRLDGQSSSCPSRCSCSYPSWRTRTEPWQGHS